MTENERETIGSKLKNLLMKNLFLHRMFENALNDREADDIMEEEGDDLGRCRYFLLHPGNKKKEYYEYFISFVSLADLLFNTYALFIGDELSLIFNYIVIPLFLWEIYLSCVSTFYKDSILIRDFPTIFKTYLKKHMVIDILSTLPFFAIGPSALLLLRILRILKLSIYLERINHLVYLALVNHLHSRKETLMNIQKGVRFVVLLGYTLHTLTCIWVWLGKQGGADGWVEIKQALIEDPNNNSHLYIGGLYWVMTTFTTVGYGDFTGYTNEEYMFMMLTQFMGIGFFGYIIGNINSMVIQIDSIDEMKKEEEERINIWLMKLGRINSNKALSSTYYDHINWFYQNFWNMDFWKIKENEFYNQLKPRLRSEVDDIWFQAVYDRFEGFFNDLENGFRKLIVHNLVYEEHRIFPPYTNTYKDDKRSFPDRQSNILLEKDKIPDKIFFFVSGEAYASNSTGRYIYFKLPDGSFFGEAYAIIGKPLKYSLFYNEEQGCSALTIESKTFIEIWKQYPDSFRKLRERSRQRRKILSIYKQEALAQIIQLSLRKFRDTNYYEVTSAK
jgi:hypothetical protein